MKHRCLPDHHRYLDKLGPTPLVGVSINKEDPTIWCKLEFLNPSRSIKDRIARYILEKAWRQGKIEMGGTVVEASSGSTSIALALVCAQMGLKFVAVMPEGVSHERELIMRAFGADVVFSPKEEGMQGAMEAAEKLARKRHGFLTHQFENADNAEAHYVWTGQEILSQMHEGNIDAVVCGVGTGGTIVGLTKAFKEAGCDCIPVVAIPTKAQNIGGVECSSFSSHIPGIVDSMSKIYDKSTMPDVIELKIKDSVAIETTRQLMHLGFPVGPSSGLNYAAAREISKKLGKDAQIVTVFPDGMEKYFSTELFAPIQKCCKS